MHFFSQYRGLRRENYVLFFGRIVTNMGSMVWPMLTMILNQKLGMSAGNIAILTAVFGILMMPATLFGGKLADRLKAGQQFAMYLMWYGLGRTWIENVRINYSTVILGLRTNVWTAIIVFVLGCILFVVLYQYGPDPKAQARGLAAVTADELERQSIEEEQLRQKKQTNRTK